METVLIKQQNNAHTKSWNELCYIIFKCQNVLGNNESLNILASVKKY